MATKKKMLQAAAGSAGGGGFTAIEDVFSTYLYTGNGSTQTITNGIDLATEGGLVWHKSRSAAIGYHRLFDTERGGNSILYTNTTNAAGYSGAEEIYLSDGFTINGNDDRNLSGDTYASWTFRKAPRFFDVVTYTGTGAARTIAHNLGTTVGSIIIKRTDTASNWAVYHRGNTAAPETDYLSLNLTGTTADDATFWNDTAPTDSVFTVGTNAAVNASGGTYVAYLFAHDPLGPSGDGSDGLISCGSYTGSSNTPQQITLGYEPQWVLLKRTGAADDWWVFDNMRGMALTTGGNAILRPNTSGAEAASSNWVLPNATGFVAGSSATDTGNYIYIAIRRGPMRVPTSGTEVFALNTYSGTGAVQTITTTINAPDAALSQVRNTSGWSSPIFYDRIRGKAGLFTDQTAAEVASDEYGASVLSNAQKQEIVGSFGSSSGKTYATWSFKRAPNFFDVVAYTGDGTGLRTHTHNLGVTPEMYIIKKRNTTSPWYVYHNAIPDPNNTYIELNSSGATSASGGVWGGGPTASSFDSVINTSAQTHIAYLFASLAGVSKVGSYTGNGSSQTINCGFTTGARFILIKRTDSAGDWYVWDTARGIVAGNDPHLSLNTSTAEVTSDDSIDPASSGFIVNQLAATNINVSAASYIFYAVA